MDYLPNKFLWLWVVIFLTYGIHTYVEIFADIVNIIWVSLEIILWETIHLSRRKVINWVCHLPYSVLFFLGTHTGTPFGKGFEGTEFTDVLQRLSSGNSTFRVRGIETFITSVIIIQNSSFRGCPGLGGKDENISWLLNLLIDGMSRRSGGKDHMCHGGHHRTKYRTVRVLYITVCWTGVRVVGFYNNRGCVLISNRLKKDEDRDCLWAESLWSVVVYYESRNRTLKTRPIYECRCDGRLKTKDEKSSHTLGWSGNWNT
jgi:hypothetical protein